MTENDEREKAIKDLVETAYRMLCYIPRSYESEGPRGEMERAILAVKDHGTDDDIRNG